jgi:hypothetical protein
MHRECVNQPRVPAGTGEEVMRVIFGVLPLVMLLFAVFQYNDPDGPLWMLIYGVPVIWAGIAACRPRWLAGSGVRFLLALSVVAAVALTMALWPPVEGWWQESVWSMSLTEERAARTAEQSREGMGLMIATGVLVLVLLASLVRRPAAPARGG